MNENIHKRESSLDFFRNHPVFTIADFENFLDQRDRGNQANRKRLLHYHKEKGHLLSLRSGLYASVPPGASAETFMPDRYLIAAHLTPDALIAYHSALSFHGFAHSLREGCTIVTATPLVRPFSYQSTRYRTVTTSSRLLRANQSDIGIELRDRTGHEVRVTSLERTLVDMLDRLELSGGWEEVWRSYEAVTYLDLDAVIHYALMLGNATTIAKVGYFLESQQDRWMVSDASLHTLRQFRPAQPHYINREHAAKSPSQRGRLLTHWNLIISEWILQRRWEESDAAVA